MKSSVFLLMTNVPWLSRIALNIATRASSWVALPGWSNVCRSVHKTITENEWISAATDSRVCSQMST